MGWFALKPYDIVGKIKYIHLKVFMDIKKEYIARTDLSCLVIEPYRHSKTEENSDQSNLRILHGREMIWDES